MRVLYYIAYPARMAGANRSLFALIQNLPGDIEPFVVLTDEGRASEACEAAGIPHVIASPGRRFAQSYGHAGMSWSPLQQAMVGVRELLPYTLRLARLIRRERADIVHLQDQRSAIILGGAARLARRPVVGHLRGEIMATGKWLELSKAAYALGCDRVITVSDAIQSVLSPAGRRKAVTVYNGMADVAGPGPGIPWLDAQRERGVTVISCLASVVPFKAQHHLLSAAAELNRRGLRDRFLVLCIGEPLPDAMPYYRWLQARCETEEVDNFMFSGWTSEPFDFYRSTDVSVMVSVSEERLEFDGRVIEVRGGEGFPRTHLEAMCFSLPVVGSRTVGVPEQINDGENGFIVPPSDPLALADALERLITDPKLRQRLGAAGRERVLRDFSIPQYVEGVCRVYRELTGRR